MGRLGGRVRALEVRERPSDIYKYPFHEIVWNEDEGQSRDEAIDAYGRERIGPNDNLIIERMVSPKFDAEGKMIPQRKGDETEGGNGTA